MTIAYICGENSIWSIRDRDVLEMALEQSDKELVRRIAEDEQIRGKFRTEYLLMTKDEFIDSQRRGEDVLLYLKEDIRGQLRRLLNK